MKTYTITFADGTKLEKLTLNNGANTFHSETEITPEMLDSVASGYVTMIGQIKPMVDLMNGYGIDIL